MNELNDLPADIRTVVTGGNMSAQPKPEKAKGRIVISKKERQ